MDYKLSAKLKGLPTVEATEAEAAAVANPHGLVVLVQRGEPIGAIVNRDELMFILDARDAELEDTASGVEEPPSGQHRAVRPKDH